jgi:cytidylate kinase
MIVTIDGPAGSGKSTTARAVAERLGYLYLDTGAMYRAVALAFLRAEAEPTDEAAATVLPEMTVDVGYENDAMHVYLNGEDVSDRIRTAEVGDMASRVSTLRAVREKMVDEQRRIGRARNAQEGGVVLDGRDTGTVVFPDADVKIYMTADSLERARRRRSEYSDDVSLEAVHQEIQERDRLDRERDIAPLRQADDAQVVDTTACTFEEQVDFVVDCVKQGAPGGT